MKNALITAIVVVGLLSFSGFRDAGQIAKGNRFDSVVSARPLFDTIPAKRDSSKWRSNKTPYDSFGKPKKMDSLKINQAGI